VSNIHSASKSSALGAKSDSKSNLVGTLSGVRSNRIPSHERSSKATGKHTSKRTKQPRTLVKDRTETCAVQFVPKFNPNSNKNQMPVYHLIRHAFGNMVREALCQLDKDKSGVNAQQISDHILKHYEFPVGVSEGSIRNRAMFTINSGLRAGTLVSVNANKGVRIGRMRHNYPRLSC
jgi:hypothetical protein